jgi:hypothetical protein
VVPRRKIERQRSWIYESRELNPVRCLATPIAGLGALPTLRMQETMPSGSRRGIFATLRGDENQCIRARAALIGFQRPGTH